MGPRFLLVHSQNSNARIRLVRYPERLTADHCLLDFGETMEDNCGG